MITLVYRSQNVAPICHRICEESGGLLQASHETSLLPHQTGIVIRYGSAWPGEAQYEINTAEAVRLANDKPAARARFGSLSLPLVRTLPHVTVPCVVRPRRHFGGRQFYICRTLDEVRQAVGRCGPGWYASPLISKDREFRVFVLQNSIIGVTERFPSHPDEVAWNTAQGGLSRILKRKDWPIPVLDAACQAVQSVGLDWAAVDVIMAGRPYVLEVNTAPGVSGRKRLRDLARAFMWLETTHERPDPTADQRSSWKEFIHPAFIRQEEPGLGG